MSRNQFRDIFSNFHLANKAEINADRCYKMHLLFDILNSYKHFIASDHNIDETIIPFLGKDGAKQFMCDKLICFGFKLWCLASINGYLLYFSLNHAVKLTLSCQIQVLAKVLT